MENIKCEKCGHTMVEYETDTCEGMRCPNCGWGWITTKHDSIDLDESVYNVSIDCDPKPSKEQLKVLSNVLNANYLVVNKLLKEGNLSFNGNASEVKDKLKKLQDAGISFSISPDFPYKI